MILYTAHPEDSPVPTRVVTGRLILRAPRGGDGPLVHAAIRESFETLTCWMPWARRMPTVAESETFVRESAARFRNREDLTYLIFAHESDLVLGAIGLHSIDWGVPRFELGYWLRNTAHRQGYMTEAVRALTAVGFDRLSAERMEIRCDSRNSASASVAVRSGYQLEAILRRHGRDNSGGLRDTLIFARFSGDGA
jgi:RimJ/RimL family protein N-acetyltransferase